jgi:hypothetical protein
MKRQRQGGWLNPLQPLRHISLNFGPFGRERAFSDDEHYLHLVTGAIAPRQIKHSTQQYWVLSRALYTVRIIELKGIPADKKSSAISLAATAWTPFANTTHYIIEQQDSAILCGWDSQVVSNAQALADVMPDDVLVLPETALRDYALPIVATDNHLMLYDGLDGVVAVVISNMGKTSRVEAEQWWSLTPNAVEWQNFQRSLGIANDKRTASLQTQKANWRKSPIGYLHGQKTSTTTSRERWVMAIAAWLLVIPTLWYANEWRQLHQLKTNAIAKLTATERELDATLGARGQAISGLDRATKLSALFSAPNNLAIFSLVNNVLAQITQAGTLQLTDWELRGSQLKMSLLAPSGNGPSATIIVKAFEKAQTLRDVEVNVDGSRTTITLKIVPASTAASTITEPPKTQTATQTTTQAANSTAGGASK